MNITPPVVFTGVGRRACRVGLVGLLVAFAIGLGGCAHTPVGVAKSGEWIEVRSQHFTLISAVSPQETREIARDLELFRAAVLRMTTVSSIPSQHPTWVYVFGSKAQFGQFNSDSLIAGYMLPSLRANVIALNTRSGMDALVVAKHEYTHWLAHTVTRANYPFWLDEGFAEFMSTATAEDGLVWIGLVPEARIPSLRYSRWLKLESILDPDDYDEWSDENKSMLYAESWAFVHYLLADQERRAMFDEAMPAYIEALESGTPTNAAFEQAFGFTVDEANERLVAYLRDGRFPKFATSQDKMDWSDEVSGRVLSESETAVRLGTLSMIRQDFTAARSLFEHALALVPGQARAQAGVGDTLKFAGEFDEARPYFERAVELGPDDPLNHLDYGEYWMDRARTVEDPDERRQMLRSARRAFVRAHELDDAHAEIYAMYGATFLMPGEDASRGIESLEEAYRLLPADNSVRMLLAEAYLRTERRNEAVELVRSALFNARRGRLDDAARATLAGLEDGTIDSVIGWQIEEAEQADDPERRGGGPAPSPLQAH